MRFNIPKQTLTKEQELELFKKYNILGNLQSKITNADDKLKTEKIRDKIRDTLIQQNMRLVFKLSHNHVRKLTSTNLEFSDIVQIGMLGLMKAVDGFDPNSGYKFSSYASTSIDLTILRHINNLGRTIRIPEKVSIKHLKLAKQQKNDLNDANIENVSIYNILFGSNDNSDESLSYVRNDVDFDTVFFEQDLKTFMMCLTDKELYAITNFYGLFDKPSINTREISKLLDVSTQTVYTILKTGIEKLQKRKELIEGWANYEQT